MTKLFLFPFRLLVFWLIVFNFFRLLLLITQALTGPLPFPASLQIFPAAFMLDVSAICYMCLLPLLLFIVFQFIEKKTFAISAHIVSCIFIILTVLIASANVILVKQWGTIINYRALSYLGDFSTVFASVTNLQVVFLVICLIVFLGTAIKFYNSFVKKSFIRAKTHTVIKLIAGTVLIIITGAYTRGGFQQIPINESAAYFSSDNKLNLMATNPSWHLLHSVLQAKASGDNVFNFYDRQFAESLTENLVVRDDTLRQLFTSHRPNVVFILLESFTADAVAELGGDTGISPNFSDLIREGLFFTGIYSSGARTDVALPSVFSGFPAQPNHSIMRFTEKTSKLPSIVSSLKNENYSTSFYYGGDLKFSNMLSYLSTLGFEEIIGKDDFDERQFNSKWGAQDEFVFERHLKGLDKQKEPFFSTILTLSSHEPYESPLQSPFSTSTEKGKFKNVLWYTDHCLGNYFREARKKDWYNNTVFIVMADHGNGLIRGRSFYETGLRHIPLLIAGDPLAQVYHGKRISCTGSQHDIVATLLSQLGVEHSQYLFSNNLLNERRKNYAYQNMDDAVGWVTDSCRFVFNLEHKRFLEKYPPDCKADTVSAKAYIQSVYSRFLEY